MELYWQWMCNIEGMYENYIRKILYAFKNPANFYQKAGNDKLEFLPEGLREKVCRAREMHPEEIYHRNLSQGIEFISLSHPDFPECLREIPRPPFGLFYKGKSPGSIKPGIGVVGARRCSGYGHMAAQMIGEDLGNHQIPLVSGMAAGIDGTAQRAAMDAGGASLGVLGCGVDVCYPRENRMLYERLIEQGSIISEFPPGTKPLANHFPMRNRIVSGLSKAVIVVEARRRSGSLITADFALEQGRDVYAVPGRFQEELSMGCNNLIAQGAAIFTSVEEMLGDLSMLVEKQRKNIKMQIILETVENLVYSCLDLKTKSLESILIETKLSIQEAAEILMSLKIKGLILENPKNYYRKIR